MKKIVVSIPTPCHENWQNMSPAQQGRFCSSCQKQVIDFSIMDDAEVYKTILKGNADMCGRFLQTQLDSPITYPDQNKLRWQKYFFSFFIPAFLLSKQTHAQKLMGKVKAPVVCNNSTLMGDVAMVPINNKQFEISGTVLDSATGEPLQTVSIQYGEKSHGTTTDSSGYFFIEGHTDISKIKISISGVGYETKEIEIRIPANGFKMMNEIIYLKKEIKQLQAVVIKSKSITRVAGGMMIGYSTSFRPVVKELPKKIITIITDSLKVYPNPVPRGNYFNVSLKLKKAGNYIIQVMDVTGKIVVNENIDATTKQFSKKLFCDDRWAAGTYFIRVLDSKSNLMSTSRLIMQ